MFSDKIFKNTALTSNKSKINTIHLMAKTKGIIKQLLTIDRKVLVNRYIFAKEKKGNVVVNIIKEKMEFKKRKLNGIFFKYDPLQEIAD